MVTLQILVLSFLVRIQVAQLKRLSFEGRFFCFLHCGERCSFEHIAVLGECHDASIMQTLCSICKVRIQVAHIYI